MTKIKSDNSSKIFEMIENGTSPEEILVMFPQERKEIQEMISLISLLKSESDRIEAPKEILQEILEKNRALNRASGRASAQKIFNKLINNLNFMDQKLKISASILGVIMIITVGIIAYKFDQDKPEIANIEVPATVAETKVTNITPVIGNKEVDASINSVLNNVLNEDSLDSELADIELAISDEAALDEINNLINDDEL